MKNWNYEFEVPKQKRVRVIVHTDCKNEADDQFALAHHLMTQKFIVTGIIGGHFNKNPQEYGEGNTAQASMEEIDKILELMGLKGEYKVYKGAEYALENEETPIPSDGAKYIIEEAMEESDLPLYAVFQGAITDLASAILMKPEICGRMTAIWIGGGLWPKGGFEFNLMQDIAAANVVFKSSMPLWQVPITTYKQMAVTLAELQVRVKPYGRIGNYLFTQMAEFNKKLAEIPHWPHGETWGLGDQAAISVLMEEAEKDDIYDMRPAPCVNYKDMTYIHGNSTRDIRVYKTLDPRATMEDFYAKLSINFPRQDS